MSNIIILYFIVTNKETISLLYLNSLWIYEALTSLGMCSRTASLRNLLTYFELSRLMCQPDRSLWYGMVWYTHHNIGNLETRIECMCGMKMMRVHHHRTV